MDAAAHHASAFLHCTQGGRHERADRRENDGGIERFRRHLIGAAGPHRAERAREILRSFISGAGECVDTPPLPGGDLCQDVGGGAEAVETNRSGVTGHAIAAPADQPGAKQRSCFRGINVIWQRKAEPRIGQSVRRIAAIARIAGEQRPVAEIFTSIAAIGANPAGRSKPGHADSFVAREASDIRPHSSDAADDFVPRHDGELCRRQLAVDDMQIGAANPACFDFDQDFAGSRSRNWALPQHESGPRPIEHHRAHV